MAAFGIPVKLSEVSKNIWRGSRPKNAVDFARLKALGITTIVSLQGSLPEFLRLEVAQELEQFVGKVHWVPLGAVLPPPTDRVFKAVSLIEDSSKDGAVLVHCEQGVDRTGFVIAAYRIFVEGWARPIATREMWQLGFHWWYFYWTPRLRHWGK